MEPIKIADYTRTHDLTIEEVRSCPHFAHLTDKQAEEVIEALKILTKIAYDFYKINLKKV